MQRLLLLIFSFVLFAVPTFAQDEETPIEFPVYDIGEVSLGARYKTVEHQGFAAVLHVKESGLLRVMSYASDYPFPFADAAHQQLLDHQASFYDGMQGYIIDVKEGDVIYFFRSFCMSATTVWFEMQAPQLTYTCSPAANSRLVPTGRAQFELFFNMPVQTSGGTMTCGGSTVQLGSCYGNLYILYEIKDIIMRWLDEGKKPGSDITITLNDVCACISDAIKAGNDGTVVLHYKLPERPGMLVSTNFDDRTFKSYWLNDDEEGLFRMTFTRPVSITNPGYISLVYGDAEAGDAGEKFFQGKAEGNDIVFDLRGQNFTPKSFIDSGSTYPSIMLRPGGVCDENGDYMFSPGIGTIASWTYNLPYSYLRGIPRWEFFDNFDNDIEEFVTDEDVNIYVYNYHVVRADGILLTFPDGSTYTIPMSNVSVAPEANGTDATLTFAVPYVSSAFDEVTVSFANLRLLTGEAAPTLAETFGWHSLGTTGVTSVAAGAAGAVPAYDLSGRRVRRHESRPATITVEAGKKTWR